MHSTTEYTPTDTTDDVEDVLGQTELETIKRKSVANAITYFFRTLLLQGIGLASGITLSYYLNPTDFAIFAVITSIVGILSFFSDIGLAAALIQQKHDPTVTDYRTAFTVQQLLSWAIVGIVVVLVLSGLVEARAGSSGVAIMLCFALSFPLATLKTIPSIMLERKLDFSKLVVPAIVEQLIYHGILIALVWLNWGVIAYAYAILLRSIAGVVVMMAIQSWPIGFSLDRHSLKKLLGYGAAFQLNDLLARIKDDAFYVALSFWIPQHEYGLIRWAKNWSVYPYSLTVQNVMAITFPTFSRIQHDKRALKRAIEKSLYFISLGIFPILVGMCIFIFPFVQIFDKWLKWEPALASFVMFALSIGWAALSTPLTNTLNAIGHIHTSLKLMVMWTALTWVVTPLCIFFFGFNGVALAALLISFTSVIPMYSVNKLVQIDIWGHVWRQGLAALCMGAVGWYGLSGWSQSVEKLLEGMVLTALVYMTVLLAVGREQLFKEIRSLRPQRS